MARSVASLQLPGIYFAVGLGAQHNEQKLRANKKQKKSGKKIKGVS